MKLALITDSHFGIRNDAQVIMDYQKKFLDTIFFPYLEENNIETVIHLGDLVDRRKYLNFYTSHRIRKDFLDPLLEKNVHFILGNHDTYYKGSNDVSCFQEFSMYPFQNYGSPKEVEIGGVKILFLPWIPENNIDAMNASLEAIKNSKAQICMGHLELVGFEMERGHLSQHGLSKSIFSKFEFVFSGHFHTKSQQDNIYYLGAPFEFTWGDFGTRKGFHVFDLRSRALEFVENPFKLFQRLVYNDTNIASPAELIPPELPAKVVNSYVKVIIEAKTNPYFFDRFIAQLETFNFHDLKVINQEELSIDKSDMIDSCEDTMTIVGKTIDKLDVAVDKFLLKELMNELYKEALVMEVE